MNSKNEVFEYLIDQLRQQVNSNQCEDLAHEVQSLKSELARYKKQYITYVKKTDWVQGGSRFLKKWGKHRADILRECIQEQDAELQSLKNQLRDASAQIKELHKALVQATGDVEAYKLIRGQEQSGCRKEDAQECEHEWCFYNKGALMMCRICGLKSPGRQKEDAQECKHAWVMADADDFQTCSKCGAIAWPASYLSGYCLRARCN